MTPARLAEARESALPEELEYLWQMFCSVSSRRQYDGTRALAITSQELAAWCALHGERLAPWEADALAILEAEFLQYAAKRMAALAAPPKGAA